MTLFNRKNKQQQSEPEPPAIDTTAPVVEPAPTPAPTPAATPEPPQPHYLYTRSGERIVYNQQLTPVILQVSSSINLQPLEVLTDSNGSSYQFLSLLSVKHPTCLHLLCVPV